MTVVAMVDNGAGKSVAKSLWELKMGKMRQKMWEVGSRWDDERDGFVFVCN